MPMTSLLSTPRPRQATDSTTEVLAELHRWFGLDFSLWSVETRSPIRGSGREAEALCRSSRVLNSIGLGGEAVILGQTKGVAILAIPIPLKNVPAWVAVAPVATAPSVPSGFLLEAANLLGIDPMEVAPWCSAREVYSLDSLLRLAAAYLRTKDADQRILQMEERLHQTLDRLTSTYEEVSLLHHLTQQLSSSRNESELSRQAVEWILNYLPARGCALHLTGITHPNSISYRNHREAELLVAGEVPFDQEEIETYLRSLDLSEGSGTHLYNAPTHASGTSLAGVQQLIVAQVSDRHQVYGHVLLVNHHRGESFSEVDATLMNSVGSVLGVHFGHCDLTRQQSEFLTSVVRALTSAIDAKDSYTCGHSDRVARISVVLARELGCDEHELHTIYLAGLLHDIGKIGVDDAILRKPDRLTEEEFAQVRLHPDLGVGILSDLAQLEEVLPIVRHHHEQWNGRGYPCGLAGSEIPFAARIVAVADSYDAMSSSRAYRAGMPLDKVKSILREGAGSQWDPEVISAFFRQIHAIIEISDGRDESDSKELNPTAS